MRIVALFALAFAAGCSSGDFTTGGDVDATSDSSIGADSSMTLDSSTSDTTMSDSGSESDSGSVSDSDSGSDSGSKADSAPVDTGIFPSDAGCPAPTSTAPPLDVSKMTCEDLQATYPAWVEKSKACGCAADCSVEVPRDFCGCGTLVDPATSTFPSLKPMRDRWMELGCHVICPALPCKIVELDGCYGPSGNTTCHTK